MEQKENINSVAEEQLENQQEILQEETEVLSEEARLAVAFETSQLQVAELKDKYLRLHAEFDNFRKRSMKERLDTMKTASRDTMTALLPVLDDFGRADKNMEGGMPDGVKIVYNKMLKVLEQRGLTPMESNGEAFDPELHEAVTEIDVPDEDKKGKVVDTVETGYYLNDKIIRHAKVVVGK